MKQATLARVNHGQKDALHNQNIKIVVRMFSRIFRKVEN